MKCVCKAPMAIQRLMFAVVGFCFVYKHLVEHGFCLNKYIVDKTCRQKRDLNVSFGRLPVTVNSAILLFF